MNEMRGAMGHTNLLEPRQRYRPPPEPLPPSYAILQIGPPETWAGSRLDYRDVGIVVFDEAGRRKALFVDQLAAAGYELDLWRERQDAGWPTPETGDYVLALFVARYAEEITDLSVLAEKRVWPQHLPVQTIDVLTATAPRPIADRSGIPEKWRRFLT